MSVPRFLLETSTAIEVLRGRRPDLRSRFNESVGELATSSVVLFELTDGARRASVPDRVQRRVTWMMGLLPVLDFGEAAASHAAEIRAGLELAGTPIGAYDTLIAGHARSLGLVVITENTRHFEQVPGLRCSSWRD